jgi:membrane protease YdiL (CAAX protease family)
LIEFPLFPMTSADSVLTSEVDPVTLLLMNAFAIALLVGCVIAWTRRLRRGSPGAGGEPLSHWSLNWLDAVAIVGSAFILIWFAQNLVAVLLQLYQGEDFTLVDPGLWTLVAFGLAVQLPLLLTVVLGRLIFPKHFPCRLRERRVALAESGRIVADAYFRFLPLVMLIMLGWTLLLGFAAESGWIPPAEPQLLVTVFAFADDWLARLAFFFLAVVLAPVAEELFFRGVIYRFFKAKIGMTLAMLLSAVLFALVHNSLHAFVGLVVLGVLLARLYESTGDIRVPMLFHAAFNLTSLLVLSLV